MNTRRWTLCVLIFLALATAARAGTSLSVRLIEASNSGSEFSKGLDDLRQILKGGLPFSSYRLLSSCSVRLPTTTEKKRLGEYEIICQGLQQSLSITVTRGDRVMLTTQVKLEDQIPLVLGGFPGGAGKHVLVFVAR
jgi:hypothetical protein